MNNAQRETVLEFMVKKLEKYKKSQIKLPKLMESIVTKANEVYYLDCEYPRDYKEFKDLFDDTCINKKLIKGKTFSHSESGFLDGWGAYPTDTYTITSIPKQKKSGVKSPVNSRPTCK